MKTLFLFDGAYQDAKKAVCSIVGQNERANASWRLFKKYSTREPLSGDMYPIPEGLNAEKLLEAYGSVEQAVRWKEKWFCYAYPLLEGEEDYINCINTHEIDEAIVQDNFDYGFLIVRNRACINDIIKKYETNGRISVIPVFIYTDYAYITNANSLEIRKWERLFKDFIKDRGSYVSQGNDQKVNYEDILIFNGKAYDHAVEHLQIQIESLIKRERNKREDLFIITESERTFIPSIIRQHKVNLEKIHTGNPSEFRKRIFLMMKFVDSASSSKDKIYLSIKSKIEKLKFQCIRADDEQCEEWFPNAKPDERYWLSIYLCKYGIALFEKDENGKIVLNPNIVYEMGIMKQQGKEVLILVPQTAEEIDVKLFFDINNQWVHKYKTTENIVDEIDSFIRRVGQQSVQA
jgi:hypothetical protein